MDPVLLLDDIFDKLDDNRVSYILELIRSKKIGQCFITDTSTTKILISCLILRWTIICLKSKMEL